MGICLRLLRPRTRTIGTNYMRKLATASAKMENARMSHYQIWERGSGTNYSILERGCLNADNYRLYFKNDKNTVISPFHDVPLYADKDKKTLNMVVEIPRWTNAKMEITKEEKMNPIRQDIKKGKLRYVANVFPNHGYLWNYGALPQTWEDPDHIEKETETKGDNDPLDVCEIGSTVHPSGAIIQVKILGIMGLIDEGETDWKVIVIDVNDPRADQLKDVDDLDTHCPGLLAATRKWFKLYKTPDGKPENTFAFNGEAKNKVYAETVVEDAHSQWQRLLQSKCKDIMCENTSVRSSPHTISDKDAMAALEKSVPCGPAAKLPENVNQWHFLSEAT